MKGKRILSAVLSAALLLQLSPLVAFAEDTTPLPDTISTVQSEPAPELLAEPTPEPTVEPATALPPEPEAEPTATPTPNPTAEPTATPAAETPAPDATAEPTPEPTVEPTATPDAAEQVQALIDALPDADAVTADTADEVEEQLTAIDDAKATLTDEQLGGLDFARYDAAANALLALRGEAPTDAVEMLDTIYTAPDIVDGWYVIDDENDLYWLATTAPKDVKAKLTENITVNSSVLDTSGNPNSASFKAWTPITDFAGTLDGQGHTISGLYCNTPGSEYVGLFGSIKGGGEVRHLGVVDSYFAGSGFVGGVCGRNDGTISGCYSTATVSSTLYTGGVLVGFTDGIVKNSFAYGTALNSARSLGSFQGGNTTNCFYLSHSAVAVEYYGNGVTEATAEKFQSGEVAYLLGLQDSIWKQAVNSDRYPSFTGQSVGYANDTYHNHDNAENCEICKVADSKPNQSGGVYQITTAAELKWFAATVNSGKSLISAILLKDIMVDSWTPIGTQDNAFTGTLDGNGFTVTINTMANNNADYAGLVGYLGQSGKITNIKVAGEVTGKSNVGGVVGYCDGKLENVINAATVTGTSNVGGVIGYYSAKTLYTSYNLGNTGDVTGSTTNAGGVIGTNDSSLTLYNSYSTKKQLCGIHNKGGYQNCFDTFGNSSLKVQYKDQAAFQNGEVAYLLHNGKNGQTWGQNLNTEAAPNCLNNSPQVFKNKDNDGYHNHTGETCDKCPQVPPQDSNGVYQISTEQQLRDYARIVNEETPNASAVLKADITVSGEWTPIDNTQFFQGTFDGQGHSITFLQPVTASGRVGLFARTGRNAVIQNLTVQGTFSGYYAGGIVGANNGTITNCTLQDSTVKNTGNDDNTTTGGLVGWNNGTIQNSQVVSSTVSGSSIYTGGLAGLNDRGTIQNCRVVSVNITPGESAGGLAGRNSAGVIKDSYAAVDLPVAAGNYNGGTITNCYRLGQTASVDGGETTATEQQFHSGEVAYKLAAGSKSSTPQWGQTIAPDSYPVLGGDKVYCAEDYYHNHTGSSCAVCDDKPNKNADGAYEIATYQNLLWFAKLVNGTLLEGMQAQSTAKAVLTANIAVESGWPGIGADDKSYGGSFNGGGYTVTLTGAAQATLFGTTDTSAYLNAICVTGGYLTQTDSGAVTNCYRPEEAPLFQKKAARSAQNCYTLDKLVEQKSSGATFTNCYQIDSTTSGNGIESKGNAAFTNGEVAYLLAKRDSKWGQTLGGTEVTYPTYNGKTVYFNNTDNYHNHGSTECTNCNSKPNTATDESGKEWYIINTAAELKWFAKWVNGVSPVATEKHPAANAKLGQNITLNEIVLDANGNLPDGTHDTWTPIGSNSSANCYKGTFDGDGYTISGLYCDESSKLYVGLFAFVGAGGTVKNVNIADSYVFGKENVGLLCGANGGTTYNGGTIVNCTVSGTVKGSYRIGGVCGRNILGTVQNCTSNAAVTGTGDYTGGICGENQGGTITDCSNTGTVSGNQVVGGICGYNYLKSDTKTNAQIISCTNTGTVTGTSESVGGICGKNGGTLQESYNTGTVTGKGYYTGGVCGINNSGEIDGCYNTNTGTVTGGTNGSTGGVCGYNSDGTVLKSYNAGAVTGTGNSTGGVCGYNSGGTVLKSYNAGAVTGKGYYTGGVCGYKYGGTVQKSYNAGTVTGTGNFTGGVCGYNYGGTVQKSYNAGAVTAAGTLYVGGVCGYNNGGTVQECYNTTTGKVSGKMYVGGVCGYNNKTVQDCYNTASVTGEGTSSESIGGICGWNASTVERCYNTGVVSGKNRVGAICGEVDSNATTTDCYYLKRKSDKAFGKGIGANCDSKTELKFQNGEVAYLLQEAVKIAATAGTTAPQVWGQRIGTDKTPVLNSEATYTVYTTLNDSPCKGGYSNTPNDTLNHRYDENGECIYCGDKKAQVAYTVTIPATVELGGEPATIRADGVVLPDGKQLNVKVADDSEFKVTLDGDTREYTVKNGDTPVTRGSTVLNVKESTESASTSLTFNAPSSTTYSGTYTGTVTFTVSVDNKTS